MGKSDENIIDRDDYLVSVNPPITEGTMRTIGAKNSLWGFENDVFKDIRNVNMRELLP